MKKNGFVLGSVIVGIVSYVCLKGMKVIDKKMEEDKKKS